MRLVMNISLTELLQSAGVWLSERWRPERLYSLVMERCRSRTMGQMAVGGKICILWSPSVHSGFTCDAHRLCSCNKFNEYSNRKKMHWYLLLSFKHDKLIWTIPLINNCKSQNNVQVKTKVGNIKPIIPSPVRDSFLPTVVPLLCGVVKHGDYIMP